MSTTQNNPKWSETRPSIAPPALVTKGSSTPLRTPCVADGFAWETGGVALSPAFAEPVMPGGGARSATLERMTTLSPARVVRESVSFWAVSGGRPRWLTKRWRCEPAFFAYFLCGGKESKCRPAQGQRQQTTKKARKGQPHRNSNQTKAPQANPHLYPPKSPPQAKTHLAGPHFFHLPP